MKKIILFAIALTIPCFVLADDTRFINALKNCSSYSESGNVNSNGTNATSVKNISGWQDGKCAYRETVKMGEITADINCNFTKPQLQEITSVMDAYMLTLKYSGEDVDISSPDAVQKNPVVKVWNTYIQNPNVCKVEAK